MSEPADEPPSRPQGTPLGVDPDPIEQWLRWEEQANLVGFRVDTDAVDVPVAWLPADRFEVSRGPAVPAAVEALFLPDEEVCYPRHPLNSDPSVAFFDAPCAETWRARFTSSRTLVVLDAAGGAAFALKVSTDHPHPRVHQPEKVKLREEAVDALRWAAWVERVDGELGPDPALVLVREVLAVLASGTDHGFVVRDLTPLCDGHYYLPALSLPYCGRELAALHGEAFDSFWGRWYAECSGRAKARLLARYGLQYETPNPQNLLVQLDSALHPTGAIAFRDLGDAELALAPAAPLLHGGARLAPEVRVETRNSFWAFDSADDRAVPQAVLDDWYERHERAWAEELAARLDLPRPESGSTSESCARLAAFVRTPSGEQRLRDAWERRRRG